MSNDQLREWLRDRGVSAEATKEIISTVNEVGKLWEPSARIGGALSQEEWLDEITSIGHGGPMNDVIWFLLAVAGGAIAYAEIGED